MDRKKKKNFEKSFEEVAKINSESLTYKAAINEFAVMSDEEFEAKNLG